MAHGGNQIHLYLVYFAQHYYTLVVLYTCIHYTLKTLVHTSRPGIRKKNSNREIEYFSTKILLESMISQERNNVLAGWPVFGSR
jgi:hypothetical protein